MPFKHFLLALAVAVAWGGNFPITKLGLADMPPILLLSFRFWLIALVLVPFVKVPWPSLRAIFKLAVTLGALHFAFMFSGVKRVDASTAALVSQLQVPFATLLAAVLFRERPPLKRLAGTCLAMLGVALIALDSSGAKTLAGSGDEAMLGVGLIVFAAFMWAVSNIQMKALSQTPPLALHGWMALFAAPMLTGLSFVFESGQVEAVRDASAWVWISALYMAFIVGIFGYVAWQWLLARHPISLLMPLTLLVPVIGVALSILTLGDPINAQRILGGVITLGGVGMLVWERPKKEKPA
ncbi:MAG: DMT family transporter [Elsteraceae bacterium]